MYLLHSDVSDSTIDCDMFALAVDTYIARGVCLNNTGTTSAPTTYESDLVPTSDEHVPARHFSFILSPVLFNTCINSTLS